MPEWIHSPSRRALSLEFAILFVFWPAAAFFVEGVSKFLIFAAPVAYSIYVFARAKPALAPASWAGWHIPLIRFIAAIPVLAWITLRLVPEWWLAFPRERPVIWALVMVFYPFLSALPQEFLYRRFFFWRYSTLLGEGWVRLIANAVLFGWLHVMYENWPALVLSTVAGLFFAMTYAHTRNLTLVWIEHALYGQIAFTLGLGRFFYEGPT